MSHVTCPGAGHALRALSRHRPWLVRALAWWVLVCSQQVRADGIELSEPYPESRVLSSKIEVTTRGQVITSKIGDEQESLALEASAAFEFRDRRLSPAGRDARALRSLREFGAGRAQTTVGERETEVRLPEESRLIVANGGREGIVSYAPRAPLTREAADLLELPADPLCLIALLPLQPVSIDEEWKPSDWVMQMLAGMEAVESSKLVCRVDQANRAGARVLFSGQIRGQRFGANTTVDVSGAFIFDRRAAHISQARTIYRIAADVGTVNPGLDVTVTSHLSREIASEEGVLTETLAESIPLDPPEEALKLTFSATPWGVELEHDRNWHLFHSVLEGPAPVAILRLVELGSLLCQCNLSPVPPASAGQHIPLEQFEADIRQSLGKRFHGISSRERIPTDDGRKIFRVVAEGEAELTGSQTKARVPMRWIYYLAVGPQGGQVSFVFAIEPPLLEQLAGRDRQMVEGLRFIPPAR